MLPPISSPERPRPSLARELRALGLLHAAGLTAGVAVLGVHLGTGPAWRWVGGTVIALALQWAYLSRRLDLNHRPGEDRLLSGFGPATWITLLRGLLLAGTAGFILIPRPEDVWAWAPMVVFTAAISLDLLDGYVARRSRRVTRLGEALELGMDSLAMLVGTGLAVLYGTLPWWFLSFGLASPLFRLGLWLRSRLELPIRELPPSVGRRRIAGFSMGFLSATLWPIVSPVAAAWIGLVFLVPFLVGFGRDWAAVAGGAVQSVAGRKWVGAWSGWLRRRMRLRHALWLAGPVLVWLVLKDIPQQALLAAIRGLAWWELLVLAAVNLAVVTSFSGRWWSVLASLGRAVSYFRLVGYRLAAFAVSYFTPGPHLGGEPLQVFLLHRREAVPVGPAAASVVLEKTIELLVNSGVLAVCVLAIARLGLIPGSAAGWLAAAAVALLLVPLVALVAFWAGARPVTAIVRRFPALGGSWRSLAAAATEAEGEIIAFGRRGPGGVLRALAFSLVSWVFLLWEYWLALRFLGLPVGALETLAIVGAARLANLLPFPGGLGVLEASQVMALSSLGYSPAVGAALALLIRARDVAFGGGGLLLGLGLVRRTSKAGAGGPAAQAEGWYSPKKSS